MKRLIMFIDSNNFYNNCKALFGFNPKFRWADLIIGIRNLYQEIVPESKLIVANYYTALSDRTDNPEKYDRHKKFIDAIERIPFISVIIGHLMRKPVNADIPINKDDPSTYKHVEKRTDVNIANDMLEQAYLDNYDVALLISADGDYELTVEKIKDKGIDFFLVLPVGTPAGRLKSLAKNNTIYLDQKFLEKYLL